MAISIVERITLYSNQTGLVANLRAQPLTAAGAETGSLITTGFVALGGSDYRFAGSVPNDTDTIRYELSTSPGTAVAVGDRVNRLVVLDQLDSMIDSTPAFTAEALANIVTGAQVALGPFSLYMEGEGADAVLKVRHDDIVTLRAHLRGLDGKAISTTGATLTGKVVSMTGAELVASLTVTEVVGDEGIVDVELDASDAALADYRRAKLVVIRTGGAADVTSYPAQIRLED